MLVKDNQPTLRDDLAVLFSGPIPSGSLTISIQRSRNLAEALYTYRRRMWIEDTFGDLKKHRVDLESTHLQHVLRLSRLTLGVALLYVWLITAGQRTIKAGQRYWVDRRDRRDLSIFQIGWRIIEWRLANRLKLSMPLGVAQLQAVR